jgi:hypothetical protein
MLSFTTNGLSTTFYGLNRTRWSPITERLFRKNNESAATFALLPDAEGETRIQIGLGTYKKVSALRIWGQAAVIGAILLILFSSVVFALVWRVLKWFGKPYNRGPRSVRLLRLSSIIFFAIFFGLFVIGRNDMWALGTRSWISVGIFLSSIAFPLTAAASLYAVFRTRSAIMNRIAYWQSVLVAMAVAAIALYFGYWGLIGLRLWA